MLDGLALGVAELHPSSVRRRWLGGARCSVDLPETIASIVRRALPLALVAVLAGAGNAAAAAIGSSTHISAGTGLLDVTAGPDGNLWATDNFGNAVDRISPDGTVVSSDLMERVVHRDRLRDKIASITTVGRDHRILARRLVTYPMEDHVTGPDGNLWFVRSGSRTRSARITTAGTITTFANPNGFRGITAGPDGQIWAASMSPSGLDRFVATAPAAGLSASSLDFGTTAADTRSVTVTNSGNADLHLSGLAVTGGGFANDGAGTCTASTTLAAGGSCTVAVRFVATGPGAASGTLHVANDDAALDVALLASGVVAPTAATGAADGTTVSGLVNANGSATSARFEYGTTTDYGSSVDAGDDVNGAVSATLSGLTAGTTYHYRLVATNAVGTTRGADATFTTGSSAAPVLGPVTITSQPPAVSASRDVSVAFSTPGAAQCRLDAGAWFPCASPLRLSGGPAGNHTVAVRAVAVDGTPGAQVLSRRFQVNLLAPTVTVSHLTSAGRVAKVRLTCSKLEGGGQGACAGTVTLSAHGAELGSAGFRAGAGRTAAVSVKLRRPAHGKVEVTLAVSDLAGNRRTATITRTARSTKIRRSWPRR